MKSCGKTTKRKSSTWSGYWKPIPAIIIWRRNNMQNGEVRWYLPSSSTILPRQKILWSRPLSDWNSYYQRFTKKISIQSNREKLNMDKEEILHLETMISLHKKNLF